MGKIFHVYASHGRDNDAELDLPASGYEMLDLMERLRLEPGQKPYAAILRIHERYDYLDSCIQELPDLYQLNALAERLSAFTSVQDMAAFEGLVGKEIQKNAVPIALPRLIDFAYNTGCCVISEGAMTDVQLGKFLVEHEFVEEAAGLPDSALALLDFGKIGREHREAEGGVYTGFGYVEQQSEIYCISETMDFQPHRPDYTVLLNVAALPLTGPARQGAMLRLHLPAPEEQMQEALQKLGAEDWCNVAVSILDCPLPALNHTIYLDGELPRILELSQRLSELEERGKLSAYKALLAAEECRDLSGMISLAGRVDEYIFEPNVRSAEDVARGELEVILCGQDAETLLPHIDLRGYGSALLARDQAIVTGYGLVERDRSQPVLEENQAPCRGGMEMM